MYENKAVESVERGPRTPRVQVYKVYNLDKRPENMLQPDSLYYLAVNYFKTEAQSKSEGSKWFKSQTMGVNKLNSLINCYDRNGNLCENKSKRKKNASVKTSKIMMCHQIRSFL